MRAAGDFAKLSRNSHCDPPKFEIKSVTSLKRNSRLSLIRTLTQRDPGSVCTVQSAGSSAAAQDLVSGFVRFQSQLAIAARHEFQTSERRLPTYRSCALAEEQNQGKGCSNPTPREGSVDWEGCVKSRCVLC